MDIAIAGGHGQTLVLLACLDSAVSVGQAFNVVAGDHSVADAIESL